MKAITYIFFFILIGFISSCARCNSCEIDAEKENVCTNSLLDRAKAKANCEKEGGVWEKIEY